jgi:hypothetical protein
MSDDFKPRKGKKIAKPKRKVDSDDDELIDDDIEEIERHYSDDEDEEEEESEEEESEDEEDYSDEDIDENVNSKVRDSFDGEDISVNISTLALDKATKDRLESGYKTDLLVFEMKTNLGSIEKGFELRSDEPFIPHEDKRKISHRSGYEISDIQSISLVSVQNTFPVSISANINGLRDPNATTYRKNGIVAHVIASPQDTESPAKPRLIMCPIKKKRDTFLEKFPDLTMDKIERGVSETKGLCLLESDAPLLNFISTEMKAKTKQVNEKLHAVSKKHMEEAKQQIADRLKSKNITDIRDITLTVGRAWPKDEVDQISFQCMEEIDTSLPSNIEAHQREAIKKDAREKLGRFKVVLQVVHKPLSDN